MWELTKFPSPVISSYINISQINQRHIWLVQSPEQGGYIQTVSGVQYMASLSSDLKVSNPPTSEVLSLQRGTE